MEKEISLEMTTLLFGGSEEQFVSNCVAILCRHHMKRTAQSLGRMSTDKACKKIKMMIGEPA